MKKVKIAGIVLGSLVGLALLIRFLPSVVWAAVGWVLLGLLALVLLLLLWPVGVFVRLRDGRFVLKVQVLFLRFTVLPRKKRAKKQGGAPAQKEEAQQEEQPEEEKAKKSLEDLLNFAKRIWEAAKPALKLLPRAFRIRGLELVLPVQAEEAADLADTYGKLQAAIGAGRAVLDNHLNIRYKRLVLIPDFGQQHTDALFFSCKVYVFPVIIVASAVVGLWKFFTWKKPGRTAAVHKRQAVGSAQKAA